MECHVWDLPEDVVRLKIKKPVRERIFNDAIERAGSRAKLAKLLNFRRSEYVKIYQKCIHFSSLKTIKAILKYAYTADKRKKVTKVVENNIEKIKMSRRSNSIENPRFPIRPSATLSKVVGNLIGDGGIGMGVANYVVHYSNRCNTLIKEFQLNAMKVFGRMIFSENKCDDGTTSVQFPSIMGLILTSMFGPFGKEPKFIPRSILNGNKEIKRKLLQALFDDEAHVVKNDRKIEFEMANYRVVRNARNMLKEFGIRPGKISKKKTPIKPRYRFCITGKADLKRFNTEIGLRHPDRRARLESHLQSYQRIQYKWGEIRKLIVEILKREGKMTKYQLAKRLKRKPVWRFRQQLLRLEKMGKINSQLKKSGRTRIKIHYLK